MTEAELVPAFPFVAVLFVSWVVVPALIAVVAYWVVRLAVRHELARSAASSQDPLPPPGSPTA